MSQLPSTSSLIQDNSGISQVYEYSFHNNQSNTNTFFGRFMHFQRVVDPRNFFVTRKQLQDRIQLVQQYKDLEAQIGKPLILSKGEYDKLVRSVSIVNSAVSRDTGETIPQVMRMCAFVPVNVPILFGMIISPPTIANTIFWQWFNQSFNAGLNYGNRNASSKYTNKDLALGYSAAVGSSVTMALILRKIFSNVTSRVTGSKLILINALVSSLAGGTASFLNTFCMRQVEMEQGIEVFKDKELTEKLGISKICAKKAIIETAFSRVFLSISCLMTPAVIFYLFERLGKSPKNPAMRFTFETSVFIFALMVGLPASVSIFPQTAQIKASEIEQELIKGQEIRTVFYNKGL